MGDLAKHGLTQSCVARKTAPEAFGTRVLVVLQARSTQQHCCRCCHASTVQRCQNLERMQEDGKRPPGECCCTLCRGPKARARSSKPGTSSWTTNLDPVSLDRECQPMSTTHTVSCSLRKPSLSARHAFQTVTRCTGLRPPCIPLNSS